MKNNITGEHAEIEFHRRSKLHAEGTFDGKIFDKDNKAVYEIFGSTYDSMSIKNIETQEEEQIWQINSLIPKAAQQYYFNNLGILANHLSDAMKTQLPPSDSRFRPDIRL